MDSEPLSIPFPIESVIRTLGLHPSDVEYYAQSDLGPDGRFGESYAVLAADRLITIGVLDGKSRILYDIPETDIQQARLANLSGAAQLEVYTRNGWQIVATFTPTVADHFGKIARYLDARARGMPASFNGGEEDHDDGKCPTCGFVMGKGGTCPRCLKKGKIMWRLLALLKPYWVWCGGALALILLGVALDLVPQQLMRILVDYVLMDHAADDDHPGWLLWFVPDINQTVGSIDKHMWLVALVLSLVSIVLVRTVLTIISARMVTTVGTRLTSDLRNQMFERLQALGVRYYDKHQIGSLMTRVSTDTEELQGFIAQALQGFLVQILLLIGIATILVQTNWVLSLCVLIPGPFVMYATYKFWRFIRPKLHQYYFSRWRINASLNASLSGIRVVKAFAQEDREINRFQDNNHSLYVNRLNVDNNWHTFFPLVNVLFGVGAYIVWYVGGNMVLGGQYSLTPGELIMFIGYTGMFYGPLSTLTQISQWLTRSLTAAQRIFEIMDENPEIREASDAVALPACEGSIEFRNVSFGYAAHSPVVHDLSFKLKPGEMLGIVGHSGAGKTTLINLLCRFYDVNEGAILVDGHDIRHIKKNDLRRQIGLVLQEPFLFRGTLAENIAYGKPNATMKEIIRAAKAANAHDFILRFPEGYETRIGERGAGLSGGERQRISIARAILHDPRILILDEATSSVDTETEKLIQEALGVLVKNRTTIAIAHRLSTLSSADRLMVIDHGRIEEMGTHEELMEKQGRYYRFVQAQTELAKFKDEMGEEEAKAAIAAA